MAAVYLKTLISIEECDLLVPASESTLIRNAVVHVITAWNPGDERPSREQNDQANQRLWQALVDRGLDPHRAIGADPDSDHFEESWAVAGLGDEDARAIGAEFGQVAVFRIADGTQTVLACRQWWSVSRPLL